MTHDELLSKIEKYDNSCNTAGSDKAVPKSSGWDCYELHSMAKALRAVVELHKPSDAWGDTHCGFCFDLVWEPSGLYMDEKHFTYPCPTIRAIEKELA